MAEPKLPAQYAYGRVVARAIRAVADSTPEDDPYPDGPPVSLKRAVIFRPLETGRIIKGVSPEPSIRSQHETITADLDDEGYLSLNGQRGLWLWTGTWQVSFVADLGWTPYQITVTTDHTVDHPLDLWTAAGWQPPSPTTPTVTILVPATVHDGDVLIRNGNEVTGIPQDTFQGPPGPPGPPGPIGVAPVVDMSGDQITVDGAVVGPHLTGPAPQLSVVGDQLAIDGEPTGPHISGVGNEDTGWVDISATFNTDGWSGNARIRKINGVVFLFVGNVRCTNPKRIDKYALIPKEFYGPTGGNITAPIMSDASLDILGVFALREGQYFMVNASKTFTWGSIFMTWPYTPQG